MSASLYKLAFCISSLLSAGTKGFKIENPLIQNGMSYIALCLWRSLLRSKTQVCLLEALWGIRSGICFALQRLENRTVEALAS
jgi:hypothetical protein